MDESWRKSYLPPSSEMLAALQGVLVTHSIHLSVYYGYASIEIAEVLHQFTPGRYAIMDYYGRHRHLFRWKPEGQCDDFVLADIQPPRPDCLKVPFPDEGAPPHDLYIRDTPWKFSSEFSGLLSSYGPQKSILLFDEAMKTDFPTNYRWVTGERHALGIAAEPRLLRKEDFRSFDNYVKWLVTLFPGNSPVSE